MYGSDSCSLGSKRSRYTAEACSSASGAKCEANAYGSPNAAASWAPNKDEPRMYSGTLVPRPGTATMPRVRARSDGVSPRNACSSLTSVGKFSAADGSRRSAARVCGSVPGARPRPRSMRPGCSSASVPNCSAITMGEWLGSITPPEPSRIRSVRAAMCAMSTAGADEAMDAMLWCSEYHTRA